MADYRRISELYHSYLESSNELYHFGIKGMKWGIRRFQNEDGTLTNEGKERYSKLASTANSYAKQEKIAKEFSDNKFVKETVNKLNKISEDGEKLYKKLEPLASKLDTMFYDLDEIGEDTSYEQAYKIWRDDLKNRYLSFIENKDNLDNLKKFSELSKEYYSIKDNVEDHFISDDLKKLIDQVPKNIPIKNLDKKHEKTISSYFNIAGSVRTMLKNAKEYPYFGYANLEKGPVPEEYLNKIDEWYDLQPYD